LHHGGDVDTGEMVSGFRSDLFPELGEIVADALVVKIPLMSSPQPALNTRSMPRDDGHRRNEY
jgi:hypothetical protein